MLNSIIIMGRLTAAPELRQTSSGLSVTSFTVAVDRAYSKEEKQADFIPVVCWREKADFVAKYFGKGSMIAVKGSLQTRNYEDKQGNKRTAFEILADQVSFCGSKSDNSSGQTQTGSADFPDASDDIDDDLPF